MPTIWQTEEVLRRELYGKSAPSHLSAVEEDFPSSGWANFAMNRFLFWSILIESDAAVSTLGPSGTTSLGR